MSGLICEALIDCIIPSQSPERRSQPVIGIAVFEDYHLLGKRIIYSFLRASGFELIDLGSGLNMDDLLRQVDRYQVRILLLSVLMLPSALHVKQFAVKLKERRVKLVVGGADTSSEKVQGRLPLCFFLCTTRSGGFWRRGDLYQRWSTQLMAGATAICYFDPVSSTTIIPREKYLETGFQVARLTLARINGPTATHLASGRCLPIISDLALTGTAVVGTSAEEEIGEMKKACQGKLTVLGNLNGVEMRKWAPDQAKQIVRDTIRKAAPGGGFILSDNHGEIPFQVSDDVLFSISEAVEEFGTYPGL